MKTYKLKINSAFVSLSSFFFILTFFISCQTTEPAKNIRLNSLFSENMVLQQKQDINVWGTADPGGEVVVSLQEYQKKATVGKNGKWKVILPAVKAGGPYDLKIQGEKLLVIKNVLVGEVWICSGQSNMEMAVSASWGQVFNDSLEIANANFPKIRLFQVNKETANIALENFESNGWEECSPETIAKFSAVAYFFGRHLNKELNIPIGLIQTAWGGTIVEAWTSGNTLKQYPEFKNKVEKLVLDSRSEEERVADYKKAKKEWPDKIEKILIDKGTQAHGFQNSDYSTNNWKSMKLPAKWEDNGIDVDGVVWFSKDVDIPKSWKANDITLSLGKINDYDITWFNGKRVGRGIDVSDSRIYKIPASLVKNGKNKIVVQVLDIGNSGGIYGPLNEMKLINADKSISLAGNWKYKVDPIKINVNQLPKSPTSSSNANRPTVLYNSMINPLIPFSFQGAIWYQGESNADRAYQYRHLFKSLILDWRENWKSKDFPFLFVQLANFKEINTEPVDDSWAELREAQTMALELPNTGMAVTIDIGNDKDIHPKNKQDVGKRLALNALAKVYHKDIPYSGPMYKSMKIDKNKIILEFTNTDGDLKIKEGNKLKGFAIAGKDKKFVWAEAKIDGNKIVVENKNIINPVAVRYAWAANPVCNLYNGADLPASPFRTDDWQGITFGKK